MKFDVSKAFPYPVLRHGSDDFGEAEFQASPDFFFAKDENEIVFEISYMMSCSEIDDEIRKGNAEYVSLVCCRDTYYRYSLSSPEKIIIHNFDAGLFRGEVSVQSYIVATNDIPTFYSPDINSEFGKGPFSYTKGDVLAQDETRVIHVDRNLFSPLASVFDLVHKEGVPDNEWDVEFDQDHVQIVLSEKMKRIVDAARNNKKNKIILLNSLYFGAVMEAIQTLKESRDFDDYKWSEIIRKKAHNIGCDLMNDSASKCAQKLMKGPISYLSSYVFEETD